MSVGDVCEAVEVGFHLWTREGVDFAELDRGTSPLFHFPFEQLATCARKVGSSSPIFHLCLYGDAPRLPSQRAMATTHPSSMAGATSPLRLDILRHQPRLAANENQSLDIRQTSTEAGAVASQAVQVGPST